MVLFAFLLYRPENPAKESTMTNTRVHYIIPGTQEPVGEKPFTIGWSVYNNSYQYFHSMQEGVLARAAELGMNVITHDQKSSEAEMITGAIDLIRQGVDVLIISPFYPPAIPIIADEAKKAGIPVVVVDVGTGGADVEAFIISDSFAGGSLAGEYALELIRKHNITSKNAAILKVEETSTFARRRGDAFKQTMADNGYEIVAEVTANSETTQAYEAMKNILESYGDDLAVVFCENDRMALGAAQAITEAGKTGQIMVIGFDGDQAAIDAIKAGLMQGTVAQQPYKMGALGVDVAREVLTGSRIIYDDVESKELYVEIYLIDETGEPRIYFSHKEVNMHK
jgi:ribose transport system substrate-binding protein